MTIPFLREKGSCKQLYVNGNPFLMLSGELHNSSASSEVYLEPIWGNLKEFGLNSVIVPVSWELVEPKEGVFDFSLVGNILYKAEEYNLKLALIWFGTWKNAASSYTPEWVKTDFARFPRVIQKDGRINGAISCFADECEALDARAFAALMKYIKNVDKAQTVVMMQVQNEAGVLGTDRDYSDSANKAFEEQVPEQLFSYLAENRDTLSPYLKSIMDYDGGTGTWRQVFQIAAEEAFMAYYTAKYTETVTRAGKTEYNLPMFVNAWTVQNDNEPAGQHPSGGPIADLHEIWKFAAPSIDAFAPDLYLENFKDECKAYTRIKGNPLIIPELRRDQWAMGEMFYAIGQHDALCVSPFGIDSLVQRTGASSLNELAEGGVVQEVFRNLGTSDISISLSKTYYVLDNLSKLIVQNQGEGKMQGFLQDRFPSHTLLTEKYSLKISYPYLSNSTDIPGGGLLIEISKDEFIFTGLNYQVQFFSRLENNSTVELVSVEEGFFEHENWVRTRRLNGDELAVRFNANPSIKTVKLFSY